MSWNENTLRRIKECYHQDKVWLDDKGIIHNITVYHGTRQKRTAEEIKKNGYQLNSVLQNGIMVRRAMGHFGLHLSDHWVREALYNSRGVRTIYATFDKEAAVGWGNRAPERITWFLSLNDISSDDIDKYVKKMFGDVYVITLSIDLDGMDVEQYSNLNTKLLRIEPEQILEVERFDSKYYGGKGFK